MLCAFSSNKTENGWQHTCRCCGAVRTTRGPTLIRECRQTPAELRLDARRSAVRISICQQCTARPAGCWKAVEYGCQHKYREAAQQAAETQNCPLNKLNP